MDLKAVMLSTWILYAGKVWGIFVEDKVQVPPVPLFGLFQAALPKHLDSAAPQQLAQWASWEVEVKPL